MIHSLNVVMAQLNPLVGDIQANTQLVIDQSLKAAAELNADIILFSELMLSAYPPEDLLLRPSMELRISDGLNRIRQFSKETAAVRDLYIVLGYPSVQGEHIYNMAGVIHQGELIAEYAKQCLPNYQVFDEKRYFDAGTEACVFDINGLPVALTICEDIWEAGPTQQAADQGAKLMLNLNASPFHVGKAAERKQLLSERALQSNMPIIYSNQIGGQDELIFDGGSMAVDSDGTLRTSAPLFEEGLYFAEVEVTRSAEANTISCRVKPGETTADLSEHAAAYQALVLGVRDYVNKNGFPGIALGLSGGIDSGLTVAIAVDALGKDRVHAVMMPFKYTSQMSLDDAAEQAEILGIKYSVIPIEPIYNTYMAALEDEFSGTERDTTEENLQARCRGVIMMAISNKKRLMVLTTGNKSEMAVGYATLYGDMVGGYGVLKDTYKTLVFELSRYRNTISPAIPVRVIERPPSAELAPDQKDTDSLPDYDELDRMLELYIEHDYSADAIVAEGFDKETVYRVVRLVDLNEYKRRQAPMGARITPRGFGRDRRYPTTSGWAIADK
ncbi:MAG: NAD+ synthase [Pseudomonadales bacterium]|nr:NAD+ synthase [Pseudomonadales bacterium]